ncbi:MAG TPA: sterol desaturase family protein [Candidatus Acidoferrales bacterium]
MSSEPVNAKSERAATRFGTGWISGVLSVALGLLGAGAVLCLLFPSLLTMPELREIYPMPLVRAAIHVTLVGAFVLGMVSLSLAQTNRRMALGASGLGLVLLAVLAGGSQAQAGGPAAQSTYLGLDWFLLNVLFLALIFVPLERVFARLTAQPIFRAGWRTDLAHFFISHLLVQVTVLLTMLPAAVFFRWAVHPAMQAGVAAQPLWLQFLEIVFVADFTEYWVHRAFHVLPWLWKFHAVHHSSTAMDWLAGSRMHLVDIVATRGLTFVPLFVLGFAQPAVYAYLVFVSFHAVFIHANVNFRFGALVHLIATPQFHHWHHSAQFEAVDKNFAVHLPWLDRVFGSYYMPPGEWPAAYGIAGNPVPENYFRQFAFPFKRRR